MYGPNGELIDVIKKPNKTIWRGNEQIGTINEQGQFVATPPTSWEQMSNYLSEKGLSWRDWRAISGSFYGGGGGVSGRWNVPRQWS